MGAVAVRSCEFISSLIAIYGCIADSKALALVSNNRNFWLFNGFEELGMSDDRAFRAMVFARQAHAAQVRKYTGNSYVDHLAEVAGIVASVAPAQMFAVMVAVSWLHDYIEDQRAADDIDGTQAKAMLLREFGVEVADGIVLLSDMEQGNRAARKAMSCSRLARAPAWVQTIKCADLISNTSSIVRHDPKFAVTYLAEKRVLLDAMTQADHRLRTIAYQQTHRGSHA